jgi:pimeloyl-ACP methyl ester carboxylesterase
MKIPKLFPLGGLAAGLLLFPGAVLAESAAQPRLVRRSTLLPTGIQLAWLELGDPEGETVVLLHGYTDTSRSLLGTAEALARQRPELRLILPDLRGHGASSMPDPARCAAAPERCFRLVDFAADLVGLLDHLGVARAHLVGHSLGSMVAQQIAITRPERVDRLVLIGSAASTRGNTVARAFLLDGLLDGPWRALVEQRGLEWPVGAYALTPAELGAEAAAWIREQWVTEPPADPALLAAIAGETGRVPLGTWLGTIRALLDLDPEHASRVATIAAPTLVLWATQDTFFPEVPDQEDLREALGAAARRHGVGSYWKAYGVRGLPESGMPDGEIGHNLQWGIAADVAADLAAFLRPGGAPTRDLVAAGPGRAERVRREPGTARVVVLGAAECD